MTKYKKENQQFRLQLYQNFNKRADTAMELVDALCSYPSADSPVELTLSPLFRRTHTALYKSIAETAWEDLPLAELLGTKIAINEFVAYTLREADLMREADNAETFQANFEEMPDVVFPKIYRDYSGQRVLCMEYIRGIKPTDPRARDLSPEDRDKLIDLGAAAIISMLYKDGFFHADLHPANLIILPGPKAAFIDLGMVGRFDEDLRRILLYYYYCLVMKDSEHAAHYLASVAKPGPVAWADARLPNTVLPPPASQ